MAFTGPFTLNDVLAAGFTEHSVRGWLRRQEIVELAPGVWAPAGPHAERWARVYTSKPVTLGRVPVSAIGAATIHGIWTPPEPHGSLRRSPDEHAVPEEFLVHRAGLLVPSMAWTAVQLARWQRLEGALVPLDSALRLGVSREDLQSALASMEFWPGTRRLHTAIQRADALSGSALESWSRGLMFRYGIPQPVLQEEIWIDDVRQQPDFLWPEHRLIGEADGLGKYQDIDELTREKRRQARLQAHGYLLYRWGWPEVRGDSAGWLQGLRHALSRLAA